jgi:ABC-type molybdate transport system ATPase subunit
VLDLAPLFDRRTTQLCDRIVALAGGRVVATGGVAEVLADLALAEGQEVVALIKAVSFDRQALPRDGVAG